VPVRREPSNRAHAWAVVRARGGAIGVAQLPPAIGACSAAIEFLDPGAQVFSFTFG
jgi:hypothetical protein